MTKASLTLVALLLTAAPASAQVVYVAGDSLTQGYRDEFFADAPPEWITGSQAGGGLRANEFNGDEGFFITADRTQAIIDAGADFVTVLFGVTHAFDSFDHKLPEVEEFALFTAGMTEIFDRWATAGITVYVGIPPPVVPNTDRLATAEDRLAFFYRPWLWEEAELRGLTAIDFETLFLSQPDWGDGTGYIPDGIHPAEAGQQLMADLVIVTVPEPSATLMLALGIVTLLVLGGRRSRRAAP